MEDVACRFVQRWAAGKGGADAHLPQEEMELARQAEEAVQPHNILIKQTDLNTHGFSMVAEDALLS